MNTPIELNTSAVAAQDTVRDLYELSNDALIELVRNDNAASDVALELAERLDVALLKIEAVLEALADYVPDQAQGIEDGIERMRFHG